MTKDPSAVIDDLGSYLKPDLNRRILCCGTAKLVGFSLALSGGSSALSKSPINSQNANYPSDVAEFINAGFNGLDPNQLWDTHFHLLGTGDSGSGCWINPTLSQWWHPIDSIRRIAILNAAGIHKVQENTIDRAYITRVEQMASEFPAGAKWMLFAFDSAHDDKGNERLDWSTFKIPNDYVKSVVAKYPQRYEWVASIHPYRADAREQLALAIKAGAVAIKWLPSAMNIDLRNPRLKPFYDDLAQSQIPLIVHCGEEKAVPGAGRDELGNPLHVRAALEAGVRVIVAHCASLGKAIDLDAASQPHVPAFALFERIMNQPQFNGLLMGDISATLQVNRGGDIWRSLLKNQRWHERLLHGSDYPLPGVAPLYQLGSLVRAGVLDEKHCAPLEAVRRTNPLMFDFLLKRVVRYEGKGFADGVFQARAKIRRLT